MKQFYEYIDNVQSGKRIAGAYEQLAVQRHLVDLKHADEKGFYFDEVEAQRILNIFRKFRHVKGDFTGRFFDLQPFQSFVLGSVYGWKRKDSGRRRFNKVYKKIGRKNGKTEFLAGIGNIGLCFDNAKGPEIYWAATKREQARIGWKRQKSMLEKMFPDSRYIKERYDTNISRIYSTFDDSFSAALGKESKTEDGSTPYYGLIDEYHAHPDSSLVDVIESGMGTSTGSGAILWIITTAGFNIYGPCAQFEKVCKDILQGKVVNDDIFALIFDYDKVDDGDWEKEENWYKVNPALGKGLSLEWMRSEYKKAKTEGKSKEVNFRTKNLNEWVRSSEIWVQDHVLQKGQSEWHISEMEGRECYVAWDMSITSDITGVGLLFPPDNSDQPFHFYCNYFCPKENAIKRSKKDRVPYLDWEKNENFTLTPGDWVDYEFVEEHIKGLVDRFIIKSIAYDKWQSERLAQSLIKEGAPCVPFPQTTRQFNEPIKFLEKAFGEGRIDFGNDVILRWMAGNVVIYRDATGLMKFDKRFSREKIDGMVILAMCVGEYLDDLGEDREKPYESHGVRFL